MSNYKSIVLNADDFGMNPKVNEAIAWCFANQMITSTSLIVTNASGLKNAIVLKNSGFIQNVGIHLCLSGGAGEGKPLTEAIQKDGDFCDKSGNFHRDAKKQRYSAKQKKAIYDEFCAQVRLAMDSGFIITHLDSHQHIHLRKSLFPIAIKVCRKFKIKYIRTPFFQPKRFKSQVKHVIYCLYLKFAGRGVKSFPFYVLHHLVAGKGLPRNKIMEVMCHPMYDEKGEIIDKVKGKTPEQCQSITELLKALPESVRVLQNFCFIP